MNLIYTETGREVRVCDVVNLRDGEKGEVTFFRAPHKAGSIGKVSVRSLDRPAEREYFVSVIGAEWIEREDRGWTGGECANDTSPCYRRSHSSDNCCEHYPVAAIVAASPFPVANPGYVDGVPTLTEKRVQGDSTRHCTILARSPKESDSELVLCDRGVEERERYVVWTRSTRNGATMHGHYFSSISAAAEYFDSNSTRVRDFEEAPLNTAGEIASSDTVCAIHDRLGCGVCC